MRTYYVFLRFALMCVNRLCTDVIRLSMHVLFYGTPGLFYKGVPLLIWDKREAPPPHTHTEEGGEGSDAFESGINV